MHLYLVRHTHVNVAKGICYGHADVDVADTFYEELAAIQSRLQGITFDKTYSSPLKRCTLLASKLSESHIVDERIKEFNFGKWEHSTWDDIYAQEHGKQWFDDYLNTRCPEGESFRMLLQRVQRFIDDLPQNDGNILIVTHAGIIRSFLILIEDYSIDQAFDTAIAYGQVVKMSHPQSSKNNKYIHRINPSRQ